MNKLRERHRVFFAVLLVAVLCLAAAPAVSAFDAVLVSPADPDTLSSGDVITIDVGGVAALAANEQFTYRITSTDLDTVGNTAGLINVNMPFGFTAGNSQTTLTTTGIATPPGATLTVRRISDGSELQLTGNPINSAKNIQADNYDVSITGTRLTGSKVGIDYTVSGRVDGNPVGAQRLSFTVTNINSGHLTVDIPQAVPAFHQTFTIPAPPPSPPGGSDSGGDTGPAAGPGAPAGPPAGPPALLAPPGVSATTVSVQHNEQGQLLADYTIQTDPAAGFDSAVGIQSGTTVLTGPPGTPGAGQPVGEISVTPLDPATVAATAQTGVFSFAGLAIECEPTGAQFTGGTATISFSLTPEQWAAALAAVQGNTAAMSIQTYDPATQTWVSIETVVDPVTHTVSAQVTHFSMFALFYKTAEPEAPSPQTFGQMMTPTPTGTTVATSAPVTTPVKTMLAPPSTTPSPGIFDNFWEWIRQAFGGK